MSAHVVLKGRIVRGPETADDWQLPSHLLLLVAVDGLVERQAPPEWVQVLAADKPTVRALSVGDVVEAQGRLKLCRWTRPGGPRRQALRVIAEHIRLVQRRMGERERMEAFV